MGVGPGDEQSSDRVRVCIGTITNAKTGVTWIIYAGETQVDEDRRADDDARSVRRGADS